MRFLAIALLLIASHLAQNNSENAEAKHKTFGQEKYKKIDGFVTGGHSMHSSFRKSTSGKKFAGYEMSSSISEMIDKITNGSGDIIALKSNIRSPYVYGLGAGNIMAVLFSIIVYLLMMIFFVGWCFTLCLQRYLCKSKGPFINLGCWDDKKGAKAFCKIGSIIIFLVFTFVILLFVAVMIYGSFIVTKPLDEIKEGLVSINAMANEFIGFAQESVSIEDNLNQTFKEEDTTKSLIRPILVTLHYFQDILQNHPSGTGLFRSIDQMGAESGTLHNTVNDIRFGYTVLDWIDDTLNFNKLYLVGLESNFNSAANPTSIPNSLSLSYINTIIGEVPIRYTCAQLFQEANCNASEQQIGLQKDKGDWVMNSINELTGSFEDVSLKQLSDNADAVYISAKAFNDNIAKIKNLKELETKTNDFKNKIAQLKTDGVYTKIVAFRNKMDAVFLEQATMINNIKEDINGQSAPINLRPVTTTSIQQYILNRTVLSLAIADLLSYNSLKTNVQTASTNFNNLANQIISSKQAADDSVKLVDDQINKAQTQVIDQTKKVTDQVNKYENYVQNKIVDRYYNKYMENSPYKLKSLTNSLAILFGILLIFWFALIVIQAFISIFCAKSGLLECCICSEFTILAVFGIVLIVLSLIACILGDVTKFIYGPDAIGYLTGNRILRKGSSALSQLSITQDEVKEILIYYYGPTETEAENPVRTPLTRFIDDKIQTQPTVKEVFPRGDDQQPIVNQSCYPYGTFKINFPAEALDIQSTSTYNKPYYCNPAQAPPAGSVPADYIQICWNVLGRVTQEQMHQNKTAFWRKFDGFVDETIGLIEYESISSTGYFLVDTIFITMEGGFMYFYIGMIIVFFLSFPHILFMICGRTYWTKYVPGPKEDKEKRREGYKVGHVDDTDVDGQEEEEEQEVLTTNDSGQLVVTVVKTKKGQAYKLNPQERDRENKMLDVLFRGDNAEEGGQPASSREREGSVTSVGMSAATQPWVYQQQMNPEDAQLVGYTDKGFVPQPDPLDTYGMDGVGSKPKGSNQN